MAVRVLHSVPIHHGHPTTPAIHRHRGFGRVVRGGRTPSVVGTIVDTTIHTHWAVVTSRGEAVGVGVVMVVVVHGAGGNAVVIHRSRQVSSPSGVVH